MRLDPIIPILGYERLNPGTVVAIENRILGTLHEQTVQLCKLVMVDVARVIAELRESEV